MKIKRSLYLNVSVCISIFLLSCLLEHPPPFLPFFILACNPIWGLIPLIEPWPNDLLTTTGPNWHKLWKGFSSSFFLLFSSLQRKGHNNILTKDWFHVVQITGWPASAWQSRKKNRASGREINHWLWVHILSLLSDDYLWLQEPVLPVSPPPGTSRCCIIYLTKSVL